LNYNNSGSDVNERSEGTFDAVGSEGLLWTNPLLFFPLLGFIQVLPVIWFSVKGAPFQFPPGSLLTLEALSLFVFAASFVTFLYVRLTYKTGPITVSWFDERKFGGELRVTYHSSGGRSRNNLPVNKVVAYPNESLLRPGVRTWIPVSDTKSRMTIIFARPKSYLDLGFADNQQMSKIYERLK
jgi:hypothetical protein